MVKPQNIIEIHTDEQDPKKAEISEKPPVNEVLQDKVSLDLSNTERFSKEEIFANMPAMLQEYYLKQ